MCEHALSLSNILSLTAAVVLQAPQAAATLAPVAVAIVAPAGPPEQAQHIAVVTPAPAAAVEIEVATEPGAGSAAALWEVAMAGAALTRILLGKAGAGRI